MSEQALTFVERDKCISCDGDHTSVLWQDRFDGNTCSGHLDKFGYAVPWREYIGDTSFELVSCDDCQTMYHHRILDDSSLGRLYSSWIDESQTETLAEQVGAGFDQNFAATQQMVKHVLRIRSLMPHTDELRVLDYGCGDGGFLRIADSFGLDAIGLDMSATRHNQAEKNGVLISSNLTEIDEAAVGPLHAVTMFQVLEHLPNPSEVLRSLHKRMTPGGILVVEVPDCGGVTVPENFEAFRNVHPLEHINAFTSASLKDICERNGFSSIRRPPAYVTTQVRKLPKTTLSLFVSPRTTQQYFRRQ